MIKQIRRVSIIGMGALGIRYGYFLSKSLKDIKLTFVADRERQKAYEKEGIFFNDKRQDFHFMAPDEKPEEPAELFIFAVKGTALDRAIEDARNQIGPDTVIISVLNGLTSEELISKAFGGNNVLYCEVEGTDATRTGHSVRCSHGGKIVVGIPADEFEKRPVLERLMLFFQEASLAYVHDTDIRHRLYSKWMLNVGVNQTVMVYGGTYGTVQKPGEARDTMIAAMREAMMVARKERVPVSDDDLKGYVRLIDGLDPEGMPSMRQDGLAHRRSEVALFAGTVLNKAEKLGLDVPVNRELFRRITEMEKAY